MRSQWHTNAEQPEGSLTGLISIDGGQLVLDVDHEWPRRVAFGLTSSLSGQHVADRVPNCGVRNEMNPESRG
jgi:hypothetical protein